MWLRFSNSAVGCNRSISQERTYSRYNYFRTMLFILRPRKRLQASLWKRSSRGIRRLLLQPCEYLRSRHPTRIYQPILIKCSIIEPKSRIKAYCYSGNQVLEEASCGCSFTATRAGTTESSTHHCDKFYGIIIYLFGCFKNLKRDDEGVATLSSMACQSFLQSPWRRAGPAWDKEFGNENSNLWYLHNTCNQ